MARKKAIGSISATQLREMLRECEKEADVIKAQEAELAERRKLLAVKRDTYASLLRHLVPDQGDGHHKAKAKSITDAAIEFVAANPGVRASDVVDALVKTIRTNAQNPRKNIHQTLLNLRHRSKLDEHSGRLYVPGAMQTITGHVNKSLLVPSIPTIGSGVSYSS